jgi:hypothetical protein
MSNHSRRAVLAGIATMPAFALPALALTDPSGDAELIELGRQLGPVIQEWRAQRVIDHAHLMAFEALVKKATGIDFEHAPEIPHRPWPIGSYWDIRDKISTNPSRDRADVNEHGESIVWKSIHDRMYDLIDEILELEAKTIPGLAVQAQAITLSEFELWDDEYNDNPVRAFIDAVCAFAGVTPLPLALSESVS